MPPTSLSRKWLTPPVILQVAIERRSWSASPGVKPAHSIATRMAENGISLESIVQRKADRRAGEGTAPVILVTHDTTEAAIRAALEGLSRDGHLAGEPQMIRIEDLD